MSSSTPWRLRVLTLCGTGDSYRHVPTIDTLPDDVLLEIFDCYRSDSYTYYPSIWKWHVLVYVCQRWRQIIFASPHRLNLRILCTHDTPVRKNVGVWPAFPIVIDYRHAWSGITPDDEDNVIAALEHPDRVCFVRLVVTGSQLGKMATVMQEPFPVLTSLDIWSRDGSVPVLPVKFFAGSAPRLQAIFLHGIPSPSLPTLLLSAGDLVKLDLRNIPPTGYIVPEAMVVGLAALPRLKLFIIEFQSATPRPDRIHLPPVTRTVLPSLIYFEFKGASEYLEDLIGRIDSPQLNQISIFYLDPLDNFHVAQLCKFVDRSVGPKLTLLRHAHVTFFNDKVSFGMYRHANHPSPDSSLYSATTIVSCDGVDWQVSNIAQLLSHLFVPLSTVVHLNLKVRVKGNRQLEYTDDVEWLHLLHQFSTVKTLHVSQKLAGHVALALEEGGTVAEVLPSLDLICLAGQSMSSIRKFVIARRLSGLPVTVVDTKTEFNNRLESYFSK